MSGLLEGPPSLSFAPMEKRMDISLLSTGYCRRLVLGPLLMKVFLSRAINLSQQEKKVVLVERIARPAAISPCMSATALTATW